MRANIQHASRRIQYKTKYMYNTNEALLRVYNFAVCIWESIMHSRFILVRTACPHWGELQPEEY
jgi:hypothetical protein